MQDAFDDYAEIHEIGIEDPDHEDVVLAQAELPVLDEQSGESQTQLLGLTRGFREREDPSARVEMQSSEEEAYTSAITDDEYTAIGMFLQYLEQHGEDEDAVRNGLHDDDLNLDMEGYDEWQETLSIDERKDWLLADAEDRRDRSPHVETYLEEGSFRTVESHPIAESVGSKLYDGIDPNPRRCYRNAVVALNACTGADHVQYVEGLALPTHCGRASAHAWLEIHGVVVELTWPWHAPLPPEEAVYYGVPVDTETVLETTRRRNMGFNPILLDDSLLLDQTA